MIFLYFGEDQYQLGTELNKKKEAFFKKHDKHSVVSLECETKSAENDKALKDEISGTSLFATEKLVIARDFLAKGTDTAHAIIEAFAKTKSKNTLILHETTIDKRKKITKAIKKHGELVEFKQYSPQELKAFTKRKLDQHGIEIDFQALDRLIFASENNTEKLKNDTNKLIAHATETKKITERELELLIQFPLEDTIFSFTENLAKKNIGPALSFFKSQTEKESNAPYLVFMIARQFRNMLLAKSAEEQGLSDQEIIKKTKMHPYALTKTKEAARNYSLAQLKAIYRYTLVLDIDIKSKGDQLKSFEEFALKTTQL